MDCFFKTLEKENKENAILKLSEYIENKLSEIKLKQREDGLSEENARITFNERLIVMQKYKLLKKMENELKEFN